MLAKTERKKDNTELSMFEAPPFSTCIGGGSRISIT